MTTAQILNPQHRKRHIRRRGTTSRRWDREADYSQAAAAARAGLIRIAGPYGPKSKDQAAIELKRLAACGRCPATVMHGKVFFIWAKPVNSTCVSQRIVS